MKCFHEMKIGDLFSATSSKRHDSGCSENSSSAGAVSVPDSVDSGGEFASGQPESVDSPRISDSQYQSGTLGKLSSPEEGPGCLEEGDSPELTCSAT